MEKLVRLYELIRIYLYLKKNNETQKKYYWEKEIIFKSLMNGKRFILISNDITKIFIQLVYVYSCI